MRSAQKVFAILVVLNSLSSVFGADTYLRLNYGSPVGRHGSNDVFYAGTEQIFSASSDRHIVACEMHPGSEATNHIDGFVLFAAPFGQMIRPGFYRAIANQSYFSNDEPVLWISIGGTSWGRSPGSFWIKHIEYGTNSSIRSFWATFEYYYEGGISTMTGELKYNVESQMGLSAPLHQSVGIGEQLIIPVSFRNDIAGEGVVPSISLDEAPSGGIFVQTGESTGEFRWRPGHGKVGQHRISFGLLLNGEVVDTTRTLVEVVGQSSVSYQTDPGSFPGSGVSLYLDSASSRLTQLYDLYSNGVSTVFVSTNNLEGIELNFAAPGGRRLTTGIYEDAELFVPIHRDPVRASLGIGSGFVGRGRFQVHEIAYSGPDTNRILSFWASFEHFLTGDIPLVHGVVRFNSDPSDPINARPVCFCEPVVIHCPPPRKGSAQVSAMVSDVDGDAVNVTWFVNGKKTKVDSIPSGISSNGIVLNLSKSFPLGLNSVTLELRDSAGNSNFCYTTVNLIADETPPTLVCPSDLILTNEPGHGWVKVLIPLAEVSDDCSTPKLTVHRSDRRALASAFRIGLTEVLWSVTDRFGNSTNWSQWVEVLDQDKPRVRGYAIKPKDAPSITRHREGCYMIRATDRSSGEIFLTVEDTEGVLSYGPLSNPLKVQFVRVAEITESPVVFDRRSGITVLQFIGNARVFATDSSGNRSKPILFRSASLHNGLSR